MPIKLTYDLAWRAGMDAGNRSMHADRRTAWSEEDYSAAVCEFDRLWSLLAEDTTGAVLTSSEERPREA